MNKRSQDIFSEHIRRTLVPDGTIHCSPVEDAECYLVAIQENGKLRAIGRIWYGEGWYDARRWNDSLIGVFETLKLATNAIAEADAS